MRNLQDVIDGLAPWEYTTAELLSDAGYATGLFGKWHIGSKPGRLPNDHGFDIFWGINEGSNAAGYTSTPGFDPVLSNNSAGTFWVAYQRGNSGWTGMPKEEGSLLR